MRGPFDLLNNSPHRAASFFSAPMNNVRSPPPNPAPSECADPSIVCASECAKTGPEDALG